MTDAGALDILGEVAGGGSYADLLTHAGKGELFGIECRIPAWRS